MILGLPVTITDEAQAGEEISDWIEEAAGHIKGMDLSFLLEEILHAVKVSLSGINKVSGNEAVCPPLGRRAVGGLAYTAGKRYIYGWKKILSKSPMQR